MEDKSILSKGGKYDCRERPHDAESRQEQR